MQNSILLIGRHPGLYLKQEASLLRRLESIKSEIISMGHRNSFLFTGVFGEKPAGAEKN